MFKTDNTNNRQHRFIWKRGNEFLNTDIKEIRIFPMMKKQDDMPGQYRNDRIKFYIGDVRDLQSIKMPYMVSIIFSIPR